MNQQIQIDFPPKGHVENNSDSQSYLNANLDKFSEQCRTLYLYLRVHPCINMKQAVNELDIWDLRRRIKDLIDKHGVRIYSMRMPRGYKIYSLNPLDDETKEFL